ncbi:PAS domain S-box protein [Christiangramia salexigens]|uniref:histidine kinase n=1 Tax=Christiangramia salexigens TaxID=1913577 RepID=A0A1L3J1P1_9FLAO|nr:PAS domain S-box protein [Christiangramia salexigens]APG59044.1 hypothetical protein LPB144_00875 [Christiangramia salexigens]
MKKVQSKNFIPYSLTSNFDVIACGVFLINQQNIVYVNKEFCKLTGYKANELAGEPLGNFCLSDIKLNEAGQTSLWFLASNSTFIKLHVGRRSMNSEEFPDLTVNTILKSEVNSLNIKTLNSAILNGHAARFNLDINGVISSSDTNTKILLKSLGNELNAKLRDYVDSNEADLIPKIAEKAWSTGKDIFFEFSLPVNGTSIKNIAIKFSPNTTRESISCTAVGVGSDIIDYKNFRDESIVDRLMDSNTSFSLMIRASDLKILYANKAARALTGYTSDDFRGLSLEKLLESESLTIFKSKLLDFGAVHKPFFVKKLEFIKKDNTSKVLNTEISKLKFRDTEAVYLVEKSLEKDEVSINLLTEINKRYEYVTKATFEAIWDWEIKTDKLYLGDGYSRLFGYPINGDKNIPLEILDRIHPEDYNQLLANARSTIRSTCKNWTYEHRYLRSDGTYAHILNKAIIVRDEKDYAIRIIGAMQDISRQKQEEYRLKLLESVITNTNDSIVITKADPLDKPGPKIIYVNEAFTKMTGYLSEEVIGKSPRFLQGEGTDRKELKRLKRAMQNAESAEVTILNFKKSGEEYWLNLSVSPVRNESGVISHFIAVQRDVTERKQKELQNKLLANVSSIFNKTYNLETSLELLLSKIAKLDQMDIVEAWLINSEKTRIKLISAYYSSNKIKSLFRDENSVKNGFIKGQGTPGDIWEKETEVYIPDLSKENNFMRLDSVIQTGMQSGVGIPLFYNDSIIGGLVLVRKKKITSINKLTSLFKNFGVQLGAEIKRKQFELQFKQIFNSSADYIGILGKDGYLKRINRAMSNALGYSPSEMISRPFIDFIHDDDKKFSEKKLKQLSGDGASSFLDNRCKTASGRNKWISWTASEVNSEDLFFLIGKDITEKKKAEVRLELLNRELVKHSDELIKSNNELEQFAYVASHDLQEPLRMVSSFLRLLERKYSKLLDEKGLQYIHFAVDGADRMRNIILDLLEFSRVGRQEEQTEILDLNELLDEIRNLLKDSIKKSKAVITSDPLPKLEISKISFMQIFQNLITNALKYVPKGRAPKVHISAIENESSWEFIVSDNGLGIEEQYYSKVFELFQRLHTSHEYSGTGVGLAVVKKVVENLKGEIWLESKIDKGSSFHFTIPK